MILTLGSRTETTTIALKTTTAGQVIRLEITSTKRDAGEIEYEQRIHILPGDADPWRDAVDMARASEAKSWKRHAHIERSDTDIDVRRMTIRAYHKSRRPYVLWGTDLDRLEHGLYLLTMGLNAYQGDDE